MKTKIAKKITKKTYEKQNELIKFMRFIDGKKIVVEAKDKEEAEQKFAKIIKSLDN